MIVRVWRSTADTGDTRSDRIEVRNATGGFQEWTNVRLVTVIGVAAATVCAAKLYNFEQKASYFSTLEKFIA